jgi:hypothetical protein
MDNVGILRARDSDKEIVGLDVTVYERLVMDRLNPGNLMCEQKTQDTKLTGPHRMDCHLPFVWRPCTQF